MNRLETELAFLEELSFKLGDVSTGAFSYKDWITVRDEDGCGTVRCAWGYAPKLIPSANIECKMINGKEQVITTPTDFFQEITESEIRFMFYGKDLEEPHNGELFGVGLEASLQQVINRIRYVINKYA